MARDPFERRAFAASTPDASADAPRFGRLVEATKNVFVWELREFFDQAGHTAERVEEQPRVEKYAFGFGAGLDPYETVVRIVRKNPDILEALPHIAVLATSGSWNPLTFGPPLLGPTQLLPRIDSGPEPYTLIDGLVGTGDSVTASVAGAVTLTDAAGLFVGGHVGQQIHFTGMAQGANNGTFYITALISPTQVQIMNEFGVAETLGPGARWTIGSVTTPELHVRTTPDGVTSNIDRIVFRAKDFPDAAPMTAATAADIVRIYNNRARFSHAEAITLGSGGIGVRLQPGGPQGGCQTPNMVEVAQGTDTTLASALALGRAGTGDALAHAGGSVTLTDAGGTFSVADVGRYITITGSTLSSNDGRFLITGQTPTTVTFANPDGQTEGSWSGSWFIGIRDDSKNAARPPLNRYAWSMNLSVEIQILAEDENVRTDLVDLVGSFLMFHLEERRFVFLGRSVLSEDVQGEHFQITVKPGIRAGSEQEVQRSDDGRDKVYVANFTVDVTTTMYLDREVQHPSALGSPWTITSDDLSYDETLPLDGEE